MPIPLLPLGLTLAKGAHTVYKARKLALAAKKAKQFKDAATKAKNAKNAKSAKEGIKQHKDKADIAKRKQKVADAKNKELTPEMRAKADAIMKKRRAASKVDNFTGKTHKELEASYKAQHGNKIPEMLKRQSGTGGKLTKAQIDTAKNTTRAKATRKSRAVKRAQKARKDQGLNNYFDDLNN